MGEWAYKLVSTSGFYGEWVHQLVRTSGFSLGIMGELAYQLVSTSYFLQETGHTDLSVKPKLFVRECAY